MFQAPFAKDCILVKIKVWFKTMELDCYSKSPWELKVHGMRNQYLTVRLWEKVQNRESYGDIMIVERSVKLLNWFQQNWVLFVLCVYYPQLYMVITNRGISRRHLHGIFNAEQIIFEKVLWMLVVSFSTNINPCMDLKTIHVWDPV